MVLVLVILIVAFGALLLIKNVNAFINHEIIIDAIFARRQAITITAYNHNDMDLLKTLDSADYSDMEPYSHTLFRLWDWGFTRILPKDKFELIKPYIKNKEK